MAEARRATAEDADELVRLRAVMLASVYGQETAGDDWRPTAREVLRTRLPEPDPLMVAYVVDRTDRPGDLASCAIGAVDVRLGGPRNPTGLSGCVSSVATDPDRRRLGYSRLCMTALLSWYRECGVHRVDLRASPDGEPLYRSLGLVRLPDPTMRLDTADGRAWPAR